MVSLFSPQRELGSSNFYSNAIYIYIEFAENNDNSIRKTILSQANKKQTVHYTRSLFFFFFVRKT